MLVVRPDEKVAQELVRLLKIEDGVLRGLAWSNG